MIGCLGIAQGAIDEPDIFDLNEAPEAPEPICSEFCDMDPTADFA